MADDYPSHSYCEAIRRAFAFARETGSGGRPLHFLIGIAGGDDAAARALRPADGRSARPANPPVAEPAEPGRQDQEDPALYPLEFPVSAGRLI